MTSPAVLRLLTGEGYRLLASLPPYDAGEADRLNSRLRAEGHDPELVAAALTQSRLRSAARSKLGAFAGRMLFTEDGLQQATRLTVAARHAQRFRAADCERVLDLGCGLGVDSLALAGLGIAVDAIEKDPVTAELAAYNLLPFEGARVLVGDSLDAPVEAYDGAFADPARRAARGRVFDPSAYSPPLDTLLALRERQPALGVKIAPGISYEHLPPDAQAQWVSVGGDVVEAGLWFGPLAPAGPGRSALVLDDGGGAAELVTSPDPTAPATEAEVGALSAYVVEPDGAVIRAGGVATLAEAEGLVSLSPSIAYLSGPHPYAGPFGECFEVLDHFPYSTRRLAGWCRSHDVGTLEIKKRGVDVAPDRLRKELKLSGSAAATVILTRVEGRHSVVVVRRTPRTGTMEP